MTAATFVRSTHIFSPFVGVPEDGSDFLHFMEQAQKLKLCASDLSAPSVVHCRCDPVYPTCIHTHTHHLFQRVLFLPFLYLPISPTPTPHLNFFDAFFLMHIPLVVLVLDEQVCTWLWRLALPYLSATIL